MYQGGPSRLRAVFLFPANPVYVVQAALLKHVTVVSNQVLGAAMKSHSAWLEHKWNSLIAKSQAKVKIFADDATQV